MTSIEGRVSEIMAHLEGMADANKLVQQTRLGINTDQGLGISIYELRKIAKQIGSDQVLAEALWETGVREARLLAGYIADPARISEATMERWAADFDSWDIVDQVTDAIAASPYGYQKAFEWSEREGEFVKRTAFVIMCSVAIHDKAASDETLMAFFPILKRECTDERHYVKKAVNWALRNIGKRNLALNAAAIQLGEEIAQVDSKAARWIASDALRELRSEKVQERLIRKRKKG